MGACSSVSNSSLVAPLRTEKLLKKPANPILNPPKNKSEVCTIKNILISKEVFVGYSDNKKQRSKNDERVKQKCDNNQIVVNHLDGKKVIYPSKRDMKSLAEPSPTTGCLPPLFKKENSEEDNDDRNDAFFLIKEKTGISRLVPFLSQQINQSSILSRRRAQNTSRNQVEMDSPETRSIQDRGSDEFLDMTKRSLGVSRGIGINKEKKVKPENSFLNVYDGRIEARKRASQGFSF